MRLFCVCEVGGLWVNNAERVSISWRYHENISGDDMMSFLAATRPFIGGSNSKTTCDNFKPEMMENHLRDDCITYRQFNSDSIFRQRISKFLQ